MKKACATYSVLLCLFFFFCFLSGGHTAQAETIESGYSIHIQKYKIDEVSKKASILPVDCTKAEQVTDVNGKALEPMAGVSYEIVRVTPKQSGTGFEPLLGENGFWRTITTDTEGKAQVTNLVQGMYRISENTHDQLKEVMEPVYVELPFHQRSGEPLKEVYIYPKSSITTPLPDTSRPPGTPETPTTPGTAETPDKLPQTSGNIGTYQTLAWVMVMIFAMGLIGVRSMYRKKDLY